MFIVKLISCMAHYTRRHPTEHTEKRGDLVNYTCSLRCVFRHLSYIFFAGLLICHAPWVLGQPKSSNVPPTPGALGSLAVDTHPDAVVIERMLELSLGSLAIDTCRERSQIYGFETESHAQWILLEMHAVASNGASSAACLASPEASAQAYRDQIYKDLRAIEAKLAKHKRAPWARQKRLRCQWLLTNRTLAAILATPSRDDALRQWTLSKIRESLQELELLESELRKLKLPDRKFDPRTIKRTNVESPSEPNGAELIALNSETILLQTDFLFQRSMLYPQGSTERIAAATEMLSTLEKALARITDEWAGRSQLELARVVALLQLDRSRDALADIRRLIAQSVDDTAKLAKRSSRWERQIAALGARACRDGGDLAASDTFIKNAGGWERSPDLALEYFTNLVARSSSNSDPVSNDAFAEALRIKSAIGQRFGGYWQQRSEAILVSANMNDRATENSGTSKEPKVSPTKNGSTMPTLPDKDPVKGTQFAIEILLTETKQLLAANRWKEAVDKIGQAESAAVARGSIDQALACAIQAAGILQANGQPIEAANTFYRASTSYSQLEKSAAAGLMAAWLIRPSQSTSELSNLETYHRRLSELLERWPASKESDNAIGWLEESYLANDQWSDLGILWVNRLKHADQLNSDAAVDCLWKAISRYATLFLLTHESWLEPATSLSDDQTANANSISALSQQIMLAAAQYPDQFNKGSLERLVADLQPNVRWKEPVAMAGYRSDANAKILKVETLSALFHRQWTDTDGIRSATTSFDGDSIGALAMHWLACEIRMQMLMSIGNTGKLESSDVLSFESLATNLQSFRKTESFQSMVNAKRLRESVERSSQLYEAAVGAWKSEDVARLDALSTEFQKDARRTYRLARLRSAIPSQRAAAIRDYRKIGNGFPAGTEPWLEARARTVHLLRASGDQAAAKKLIDLVFASYPSAHQVWDARFDAR